MPREPKTVTRRPGSGTCYLCGDELTAHRFFQRHLWSCLRQWSWSRPKDRQANIYTHASITAYQHHWMDVVIRQDTTLRQMDAFLRETWLECCLHLSQFKFGEMSAGCDELEDDRNSINDLDTTDLANFDSQYLTLVLPGQSVLHEYDMGTTSETTITSQCLYELPETQPIVVVTQNHPIPGEAFNSPRWGMCGFDGQEIKAPPTAPRVARYS